MTWKIVKNEIFWKTLKKTEIAILKNGICLEKNPGKQMALPIQPAADQPIFIVPWVVLRTVWWHLYIFLFSKYLTEAS